MADDNDLTDTAAAEATNKQPESVEPEKAEETNGQSSVSNQLEENQIDQIADGNTAAEAPTKTTDQTALETDVHGLYDVDVEITAVLGTASMQISQILKLGRGAVVELDRLVGEDIEINANNRLIAKGEVIVIEDRLGVTITNTIKMAE